MPTPDRSRVFVVDDDRAVRFVLTQALRDAGLVVQAFDSAEAALAALDGELLPALVFTDIRMPGMDGLAFLDALKARAPTLPVVVMSAYTDIASTAGAFRGGALEYLSKPFDLDDAVALAERLLQRPKTPAIAVPKRDDNEPDLIGETPAMRDLYRAIGRLSQVSLAVLITGETGTGKELVARALHRESPRASKPFIALNTAAIPAELLESELFGHEAGAFTGANKRHVGRFEQAHGGTLFLDEIGDMPASLQTRLLRVLAEGEFFRVGGRELIQVDVRVIAATHQDLEQRVHDGQFRADLLHRLNVVRLHLPPLRERRADIAALAERFLEQAVAHLGGSPRQLTADALRALQQQPWPGNVRELENSLWRLAVLAPGDTITAEDVAQAQPATSTPESGHEGDWSDALKLWAEGALTAGESDLHARASAVLDRVLLQAALAHCNGHRQHAAQRLGLGRNTVTRKLRTPPGRTRR
ncbi:MAG: nitrogen regulation protein NR(I) [Xanthomonadaceae bacterium]|nr:nitrogen regulation protein NR(I) [Xanthomonadaceae bacterium]MDP2185835.1 nitrogen regulation protein NR(I) [Xanthomonadales bacterium]MDZ4116487.1 nitrogen regulation protein NR(I) [Xanthomonadaceae bacterium]